MNDRVMNIVHNLMMLGCLAAVVALTVDLWPGAKPYSEWVVIGLFLSMGITVSVLFVIGCVQDMLPSRTPPDQV